MKKNVQDLLAKLVNDFELSNYLSLNESQTRLSFIDKFWNALGWDVSDTRQVQVEKGDSLQQGKRPDYRFVKNNSTLFFVEAKKPAEALTNPRHIYQMKLYCWNGKVPLAILTDFEEFRPFRSIGKPAPDDANKGIINQFDMLYQEYPDRAKELLDTFGKDAVMQGSLDELIKPTKVELRDTVDKHFLNSLSKWRIELATLIAKKNSFNSSFELAEATQKILDRLVFLRILQDRNIEHQDFIKDITSKKVGDAYSEFVKIAKILEPKYNGLIFNPHPLSENIIIETGLFKKIVKELDADDSPYRFDEIPVEVLGTIYERFLGDEINFGQRNKVEINQKPEVRKAGGVYYTPQYIVEYIVVNTVGKLLEECKTPDDVSKLKILDPACGSGSFLLGAFDALIKWHEDYFSKNPGKALEKKGKQTFILAYTDDKGDLKLTTRMKGIILQNNIYGVDLDQQATAVAQMSLYIKVLEGANNEPHTLGFKEALLPKMTDNIKCGNSLISDDFISPDFFGMDDKERHKINPFNWEKEFSFIKESGGFDAVIGNPPWGADITSIKYYLKNNFSSNSIDSAAYFFEKSIILSKGLIGLIVPKTISYYSGWSSIRKFILNNSTITEVLDAGIAFPEVNLESIAIISNKRKVEDSALICRAEPLKNPVIPKDLKTIGHYPKTVIKMSSIIPFISLSEREEKLIIKLNKLKKISDIAENIFRGIYIPDKDKKEFVFGNYKFINKVPDVKRYFLNKIMEIDLTNDKWIRKSKQILVSRIFFKVLRGNRIVCYPDVNGELLTTEKLVNLTINKKIYNVNEKFIAGLMNSKLPSFYIEKVLFSDTTETSRVLDSIYLGIIPIPSLDLSKKSDKEKHDKMVELVDRMLKLHKDLQSASDFDKKHIQQYIAHTDREIDTLVYELYELTPAEIKVVEGEG